MPSSKPTQSGFRHGRGARDLRLHAHLKEIPAYREAFAARVAARLKPSSAVPAPPLPQSAILARFDAQAGQVRSVLECEAMRWIADGSIATDSFSPADGSPSFTLNKGLHRLLSWGKTTTAARTAAANARADIKAEAREGKFLNDIPPPTITGSGNNFTITNSSGGGRIYFQKSTGILDPKIVNAEPATTPVLATWSDILYGGDTTVTARVYRTDLDGETAWSAPTVYTKP